MTDCVIPSDIPVNIAARTDLTIDQKIDLAYEELTEQAQQMILDGITVQRQLKDLFKAESPEQALIDMLRPLRKDVVGDEQGKVTLEFRQDQIRNEAHYMLYEMMDGLRPGIADLWTKSNTSNLIKSLYGEVTTDIKAKEYAAAWDKAFNHMKTLYEASGGRLKLDRYTRIPVSHNVHKMTEMKFEDWADFIKPRLADDAINAEHIDEILKDMYDELLDSEVNLPGSKPRKQSQVRSDEDTIFFKDSKSWDEYNKLYGDTQLYDSMQDQITSMAHLVGAMEVFGSKPQRGYTMMKEALMDNVKPENKDTLRKALERADKIFDTSMGHLRSTSTLARGFGTVRNIQTGFKLGGAVIPAITDVVLMAVTSKFIGMPAFKSISKHLTTPGSGKNKLSARLLLGLEHMMDVSHSTSRYATIWGSKSSAKFAGGILKWSGLQAWTIGAKQSFGIEMNSYLTKAVMNPEKAKTARILKMYGMDANDIKRLQTAERFTDGGVEFIDPMALPKELRRKWTGMMLSETKMAVPEADAGVQALLTQGTRQGTFIGEAMRLGTQFKMFPMTILVNHWARALNQATGAERFIYTANMVLGTTMLGVLAVQAKQVLNGEEPQEFNGDAKNDTNLLFKGFVQGGSGFFVADLFGGYLQQGRYGQDTLGKAILGPAMGDIANLFAVVFTDIPKSIDGESPRFPGLDNTAVKLAEREMPNLWQAKLLLRRGVFDQLNKMTDPSWQYKQNKRRMKMKNEEGRDYWSKPGEPLIGDY